MGLLLSYFRKLENARTAFRKIGRSGYRRRVLLQRTSEGRVTWRDPNVRSRLVVALLVSLILGLVSFLLSSAPFLPSALRSAPWSTLLFSMGGVVAGALFGWLFSFSYFPSISQKLIKRQASLLGEEEILLLVQAPLPSLSGVVQLLRDSDDTEVTIFVLHPAREFPEPVEMRSLRALPLAHIQSHASQLAKEHHVDPSGNPSQTLLTRLDTTLKTIHAICGDLSEATPLEQGISPITEWILDNEYLIENHGIDVQTNLPASFYNQLPRLIVDPDRDAPRVYSLAKELIARCDARLDHENIHGFLSAYQHEKPLTIGELWALPLMLRIALIQRVEILSRQALLELRERELADLWTNRLMATLRRDPDQIFAMMAELTEEIDQPSPYFATQLSGHLYDEAAVLVPVQSWLERSLRSSLTDLQTQEQARQAADQVSIGNAISSLRQLSLMDWREVFEKQSLVEKILRRDPAGIYPEMDFETRNTYREKIEDLAKGAGMGEPQVAQKAVEIAGAAQVREGWETRQRHVGTYLIGEGRKRLSGAIHCRESFQHRFYQWIHSRPNSVYLLSIAVLTAGLLAYPLARSLSGGSTLLEIATILLMVFPASELAVEWVNYLLTRILPPRKLPKLDFSEDGIPDAFRTLVVVPMLLVDEATIEEEIEKLEIRYLANPEQNLVFSLFSDYTDAYARTTENDELFLRLTRERIQELNERYGQGRFYLFHRERTWNESEQKYIGWERKRGKLEELNRQILGLRGEDESPIVLVGDEHRLTDIRFVITLDSDTKLPRDSARRMIETLAHPLNQPRFIAEGKIAPGSYTIIQPRVSPTLPSAVATPFSRVYTDPVGTDPYTKAVSNAYMDLSGEGSYIGKGIYDPRAFHRLLSDRFPDERLLSHDLIEGAHVRTGLATDIELFDDFPSDYSSYSRRQHRWIRGDWQIAEWILPRVPRRGGDRGPTAINLLNRWKIFDNLRRSLVPTASVLLLILTWFFVPQFQGLAALFTAGVIFFHPLAGPLTWATSAQGPRAFSLRQIRHDLIRALSEAALLMHQAGLAADATIRVLYRQWISRQKLLEWTTSQMTEWGVRESRNFFRLSFWLISLLSTLLGAGVYLTMPGSLPAALPWLLFWFLSPVLGWIYTRKRLPGFRQRTLRTKDQHFLRHIARRTWRYFDDFVGSDTAWLPPDNYQVSHQNQLAMRTSPTNIGMWLLSALGAHDLGYLTTDQVIDRVFKTIQTIQSLETYKGHLLNWYNLETRKPLNPRYVSSVDSGNFIAALWTLDQGLADLSSGPLFPQNSLRGLEDTAEILLIELEKEHREASILRDVEETQEKIRSCPDRPAAVLRLIEQIYPEISAIASSMRETAGLRAGAAYWACQLEFQISSSRELISRYFSWLAVLDKKSAEELSEAGLDSLKGYLTDGQQTPSLESLAQDRLAGFGEADREKILAERKDPAWRGWIVQLFETFDRSKWYAGEKMADIEQLQAKIRQITRQIDLNFLYDPNRRLFSIGHNVTANQLDGSFYDLLASESRLGSYVAIARGDVPVEHWLSLNRPYSSHAQHRVLMSWTGTMFEYLMPLLLQRSYPNSLLDHASREAVALQMEYGYRRRVPWGISESAFGDLDLNKTYQYKAFGVPWLGLKRGLDEDLVVAPYAALLAVGIKPRETLKNLQRLDNQGLLQDYGYFEAIDFNRRPREDADPGVIVRAYMAHHQGMAFLAMVNFLHQDIMKKRFHGDARVKAAEPLLYERVPVTSPIHHISTRKEIPTRLGAPEVAPSVSKFDSYQSITPKVQLLSNNQLSTMTTSAGGGYTRWRNLDLTRWRADPTRDHYGSFVYFHDQDSGDIWSNFYHPTHQEPDRYTVHFPLDRAEYRRVDQGLETRTEIVVSPDDDVEIRRMTLTNRSLRSRRIQATTYYELALAAHQADRQHPAFNKLFIETEYLPETESLLAFRRSRQEDDPSIYAFHNLKGSGEPGKGSKVEFETDRRVFIGRGHTLDHPLGIETNLNNSSGYVLDPVFCIRREIQLMPGQNIEMTAILGAADSREKAQYLISKYQDPAVVDRAFEIAWASTQLELRALRILPDEARRFQKLAGFMLYPSSYLRPPADRVERNKKGQSGLWPYGISGDHPIALITIADVGDLGLVRQVLQAQAYWRRQGLITDVVVLNEESSSYEQPLMKRLEQLVQSVSIYTAEGQPGGVFLLAEDQLPEEDLILLQSIARISLVAARGPLAQQISVPYEAVEEPAPLSTVRVEDQPSRQLPYMELPYFNSLGGFTEDGREYVIYLGPGTNTPAPWVNVMANPHFGSLVSETGSGFTWYGNSQRNRLTPWSNDPVLDPPSEILYIRDEQSGQVWNPTPGPIREQDAYRICHGAGYTRFEHNSHTIDQLLTTFVPVDEQGGDPVKISKLKLTNDSSRTRKLSVTYFLEWVLGEQRELSQQHVVTQWDPRHSMILAENGYHAEYNQRTAFAFINPPAHSYTGDRALFLGRNGSPASPKGLQRTELTGRVGAELDPCAALQVKVELAPGDSIEIICLLGQTESQQEARGLIEKYHDPLAVNQALENTQAYWDRILGTVQVKTPDMSVNYLLNRWLLYQSLSCRIWGRSALYQSGGAMGFRDQLQDVAAFLFSQPEITRQQILLAASRQYLEGDVQHWWHPPSGAGIRSRISDDLLWLPYLTAQYVRVTGDLKILTEEVPFLIAPTLEPDQDELYLEPQESTEQATIFEHCRRAVEKGLTRGPHDLPLIGTGDWNDGLNRVGDEGRGESVWLGWFLIEVLAGMRFLSESLGRSELAQHFQQEAADLENRIGVASWDGAWYLRGYFDDGTPLGSSINMEARIDSLPQSWAWISDAGDPQHKEKALQSAWRQLVRPEDQLVLLFTPPFDVSTPSPGYIRGYPPGVRENGGQYTHAALWLAMAFARKKDGNRAVEILRMLNPVEHARDVPDVWRYTVEPYVVSADVYSLPGRVGQGGWSWYTGSAAWMYRVWTEEILGLKKHGDVLHIDPVLPQQWDRVEIQYHFGSSIYVIEIQNPDHLQSGVAWMEVDGQRLETNTLPLDPQPVKHMVTVRMGQQAAQSSAGGNPS